MDWFATQLLAWHQQHGRKDLPWQQNLTPYRVWVSEIMLQQTQVATVIAYYERFMQRFPTVQALAAAELDEVLHYWTGLGYYARARNLHKAAQRVTEQYAGQFPTSQSELESLPGIGRSTAGAIRAISMQQPAAILDGNVKRVLSRFHAVPGYAGTSSVSQRLWQHAQTHTPTEQVQTYTQAIMDLGATVCTRTRPGCTSCPLRSQCRALAQDAVTRFPEPKPKVTKPTQQARFFVARLPSGAVLLEQRPADGLWGGLWNPPQRNMQTDPLQFLAEIGLTAQDLVSVQVAPHFRHSFSHFHLEVEPIYLQLHAATGVAEGAAATAPQIPMRWVWPEHLQRSNERIGLSAVAVKLLANLKEGLES